ncbi:hypothetical protein [Burkholderia ubonensis]|uniref:hypothetical protein n=1 Tax=Burkholderia ubonensis TaxID=101571 RepID=UPI002ABD5A92|nr:hypothetical protein [Burkholderia ubonensis]
MDGQARGDRAGGEVTRSAARPHSPKGRRAPCPSAFFLLLLEYRETPAAKAVAGKPTLLCHYSHTQFNLGWMDAAQHSGPSEADRKYCEPYRGYAEAE